MNLAWTKLMPSFLSQFIGLEERFADSTNPNSYLGPYPPKKCIQSCFFELAARGPKSV